MRVLLIISLILVSLLPFWLSDLDIEIARFFYHPEHPFEPWYEGDSPFWRFFYYLAPVITVTISLTSLALIIIGSFVKTWLNKRRAALFILFCFLLGPGVLVNLVFKDNWGRPRPEHIQVFGGQEHYVPPFQYNAQGDGKSFPSGHSSIGFAFIAFWFLWRRSHPQRAFWALTFTLSLGGLLSWSRMASGAHFFSDVIWSAWLCLLSAWLLHRYFYGGQQTIELAPNTPVNTGTNTTDNHQNHYQYLSIHQRILLPSLLASLLLLSASLLFPIHNSIRHQEKLSALIPENTTTIRPLHIQLKVSDIALKLSLQPPNNDTIRFAYHSQGFGFPGSHVELFTNSTQQPQYTNLRYHFEKHGYFSELNGTLELYLPQGKIQSLELDLDNVNVSFKGTLNDFPTLKIPD